MVVQRFKLIIFIVAFLYSTFSFAEPPYVPNEVLKAVLSEPKVSSFFHTSILILSRENLDSVINTDEISTKIRIIAPDNQEIQSAFRFTKIDWNESGSVKVLFVYPPEGMNGEVIFHFDSGKAIVDEINVWET
jgi:hypothetical protein